MISTGLLAVVASLVAAMIVGGVRAWRRGQVPWRSPLVGTWYISSWNPDDPTTDQVDSHWRCDRLILWRVGPRIGGRSQRIHPLSASHRRWKYSGRLDGSSTVFGLFLRTNAKHSGVVGTFQVQLVGQDWVGYYNKSETRSAGENTVTSTITSHRMMWTRSHERAKALSAPEKAL